MTINSTPSEFIATFTNLKCCISPEVLYTEGFGGAPFNSEGEAVNLFGTELSGYRGVMGGDGGGGTSSRALRYLIM